MTEKQVTYGFGVNPSLSENHFYVIIPANNEEPVQVYERFKWTDGEEQIIEKSDILRLEISKYKWNKVSGDLSAEFNARLKKDKIKTSKFTVGGNPVEKLFGKEMMVLLWGIEDSDPSVIPEERWWLYTMTNASTGHTNDKKGWRIALRYALCENPIKEDPQINILDFISEE